MENKEENKALPTLNTSQLPDHGLNNTGLILGYSKNVNIRAPKNCDMSQLSNLINSVEPVSEQERAYNAKIGIGSLAELQNRGYDVPVYVDNSTNVNIIFDDILSSNIIDVPYNEID